MCFLSAKIQAKPVGRNKFHLVYNGPNNSYLYITSKGKDKDQDQVIVSVSNYHFKTFVSLEALIARKTKRSNLFWHGNSSVLQQKCI